MYLTKFVEHNHLIHGIEDNKKNDTREQSCRIIYSFTTSTLQHSLFHIKQRNLVENSKNSTSSEIWRTDGIDWMELIWFDHKIKITAFITYNITVYWLKTSIFTKTCLIYEILVNPCMSSEYRLNIDCQILLPPFWIFEAL